MPMTTLSQARSTSLRGFVSCVISFEPLCPIFQGQIDLQLSALPLFTHLRLAGSGRGGKSAKVMFTGWKFFASACET
jgi:hypothetical protein